ncbi:MAG TPA: hypothetical protein VND45_07510 [Thermoanaerobaculia bacterium]|nr:hypothetical protein [Thermoanaerobaculia bacterium]
MRTLTVAIILLVALSAASDEIGVTEVIQQANDLATAGAYERAVVRLRSAVEGAPVPLKPDAQAEVAFQLARMYERWADAEPARRDEHLQQALETYAQLWADPARADAGAAARNNCAQIYVSLGEDAKAADLFRIAADTPGRMQAFYAANYAGFLAARGDRAGAIAQYERALKLQPDDVATEEKLLQLCDGERVAARLWELVGNNAIERAQKLALDHLEGPHTAAAKRDLLAIVAATLAEQRIPPAAFADSEVAIRLARVTDAAVKDGIAELRRLYEGQQLTSDAYSWWKASGAYRKSPAMDASVAFASLARSLGEQTRASAADRAERYFLLGVQVSGARDIDAAVALAELYYGTGRENELRQLVDRSMGAMFNEKGAAYMARDWRTIYRFHVALGTIFARLGWDGNEGNPKTAIFQFEHARAAARQLSADGKTKVILDPRSVELLVQSYRKTQPLSGKDLAVRLDTVEQYISAGHVTSAARVLAPAATDPRVVKGPEKLRFDKLQTAVPIMKLDVKSLQKIDVEKSVRPPGVSQ